MKYLSYDGLSHLKLLLKNALNNKSNTGHTHTKSEITDYENYSLSSFVNDDRYVFYNNDSQINVINIVYYNVDPDNNRIILYSSNLYDNVWIDYYQKINIPTNILFEILDFPDYRLYLHVGSDFDTGAYTPIYQYKNNPMIVSMLSYNRSFSFDYDTEKDEIYLTYNLIDYIPTKTSQLTNDSNFVSLDTIYPIGSIYMSVNSTDPSTLFGGVWEQIKDTFLLSCGDTYASGETGGEANHKLTVNEIPSHTHTQNSHKHKSLRYTTAKIATGKNYMAVFTSESSNGEHQGYTNSVTATNQNTGGGLEHNNMPPYLAVYVWKRIS